MIEIINVTKSFYHTHHSDENLILNDISFHIQSGQCINIMGPSGCGKSTLLNIIAGFTSPTKGSVKFNGNIIEKPGPERAFIFQEYGLFNWKTVLGNVEFGLKAKGFSKKEQNEIAKYYINLVHLSGSENKYPDELSGGMKQRVSIARALAVEPDCLLMDEPFGALDSQTRNILQDEILEIWEKRNNKTIISVTHNVEEAVYLSDRVIILSNSPAKIILDISIDLPRPRYAEMRLENKFRENYDHLWQSLRNEVLKNKT